MAWVTVWGGIWCRPMTSWSSLIPSGYNSAVAGLSQCHEKLLGYFCAEDCSIPVGGFAETAVDMVRPPPGCLVRRTDAGMEQNLLAVYWRFLLDGRQSGSCWAIDAFYADRAKPHKHWRFCISLIWRVGT